MQTIMEIAKKYGTDKSGGHALTYDLFLSDLRNKELNILELGIGEGNSLKMWAEAFPNSKIYGCDLDIEKTYDGFIMPIMPDNVKMYVFDQSSRESINNLAKGLNIKFDIIIDDCSHIDEHQQISLGILYPYLNPGGLYFIEDIGVSPDTTKILRHYMRTHQLISNNFINDEANYIVQNTKYCSFANINNIVLRKK